MATREAPSAILAKPLSDYVTVVCLRQCKSRHLKVCEILKKYMLFLHDRPWISSWIKSISNELDVTIHVIASQLSGPCDVISNRLWRHQQNENRASETRGRCHGWPSTQPGTCTQPCLIVHTAVPPLFTQPCPWRTMSTAVCIYVAGLCVSCPSV